MFSSATNLLPNVWGKKTNEPTKSSWTLTETRREELLEAARSKRIAWVEGTRNPSSNVRYIVDGTTLQLDSAETILEFLDDLSAYTISSTSPVNSSIKLTSPKFSTDHRSILSDLPSIQQDLNISPPKATDKLDNDQFLMAYSEFVQSLRRPEAAELVHILQSFVKKFNSMDLHPLLRERDPRDQPGGIIHKFIENVLDNYPCEKLLNESLFLVHREIRREILEAFIMEKVHTHAFSTSTFSRERDVSLEARIASLGFISFKHLDIPPNSSQQMSRWDEIQKKLKTMATLLSPRRKMDCILNVCQELTQLLKDSMESDRYPSADEFLPALIYVILKANPPNLHSNIEYISQYRHPSKLLSEPGYFFTHLVSGVSFLEHLDDSSLSISTTEFEAGLKETKEAISKITTESKLEIEQSASKNLNFESDQESSLERKNVEKSIIIPTVLDVRQKRLDSVPSRKYDYPYQTEDFLSDTLESQHIRVPSTFISCLPDDIRLRDVPQLLTEYQTLYSRIMEMERDDIKNTITVEAFH